ncbi:hypothetical protein GCM10023085_60130 [Actinomadura viridis]|uniref:Protein GrpE n=1 Tax=Actinomadura viridis TaxID=58110 RepID=A0A931DG66_9ACTN|nr:nucleotide exchange factor GrpE [Actinomadura viridis]MBG6090539.1 molecular chaperone GrpE [Actinomadura viridis]
MEVRGEDAGGAGARDRVAELEAELAEARGQAAERLVDLQRLQAEYANYRKRVERDRSAVRVQALGNVLTGLLPVLDDIERAREQDEPVKGFQQVTEVLEEMLGKLGLVRFGAEGEVFDPRTHEVLMTSTSAEVTEPTAVRVLRPGYSVADRILRRAQVVLAEPPAGPGTAPRPASGDDPEGPPEAGP